MTSDHEMPFELAALSRAKNYQRWVFDTIAPFLGNRILEIGAGIGNMSKWLPRRELLILTEMDDSLFEILKNDQTTLNADGSNVKVFHLGVGSKELSLLAAENIDTIVSFNVFEHIEDDRMAVRELLQILRASGVKSPKRLITFVPAHQWAFGAADQKFGHHRRYSKSSMATLIKSIDPTLKAHMEYFNFIGLMGWFVSGRILKQANLGTASIEIFERLCPLIKLFDWILHKVFRLPLGQSLLCVIEL